MDTHSSKYSQRHFIQIYHMRIAGIYHVSSSVHLDMLSKRPDQLVGSFSIKICPGSIQNLPRLHSENPHQITAYLVIWKHHWNLPCLLTTLPETNTSPSQKETTIPTIHFEVLRQFQGGYVFSHWKTVGFLCPVSFSRRESLASASAQASQHGEGGNPTK